MSQKKISLLLGLIFFVTLAGLAAERWSKPLLDLPLTYDEWNTIEYYSFLGLSPSATLSRIRRTEDLNKISAPTNRQLIVGLYHAFGTWKTANNHAPNSVLINFAAAIKRSPRAIRTPSFIFSIAYAIALYFLCGTILNFRWAAPIVGLLAFSMPYVETFGTLARGYSLMLFLQSVFLIFIVSLPGKERKLFLSIGVVATACLTIFNIVSLSLDWIFPLYFALWLFPPPNAGENWRKILFAQIGCLSCAVFIFTVDRIPGLLLSPQSLGDVIQTNAELRAWSADTINFLFPSGILKVLLLLGVIGSFLLMTSTKLRFLGIAFLFSALFSAAHFSLASHIPQARTCAYFLVPVLIGIAKCIDFALLHLRCQWAWKMGIVLLSISALAVWPSTHNETHVPSTKPNYSADETYAIYTGFDYAISKALPTKWTNWEDRPNFENIRQLVILGTFEKENFIETWYQGSNLQKIKRISPFQYSQILLETQAFPIAYFQVMAKEFRFGQPIRNTQPTIGIWFPDRYWAGRDSKPILDLIGRYSLLYQRRNEKIQAEFDFYKWSATFEFLAETPEQESSLQSLLQEAITHFGGNAVLISPSD